MHKVARRSYVTMSVMSDMPKQINKKPLLVLAIASGLSLTLGTLLFLISSFAAMDTNASDHLRLVFNIGFFVGLLTWPLVLFGNMLVRTKHKNSLGMIFVLIPGISSVVVVVSYLLVINFS